MEYTKQELKHLRFRLMKQEGLTHEEAFKRVEEMIRWTAEQRKKTKKKGRIAKFKG